MTARPGPCSPLWPSSPATLLSSSLLFVPPTSHAHSYLRTVPSPWGTLHSGSWGWLLWFIGVLAQMSSSLREAFLSHLISARHHLLTLYPPTLMWLSSQPSSPFEIIPFICLFCEHYQDKDCLPVHCSIPEPPRSLMGSKHLGYVK